MSLSVKLGVGTLVLGSVGFIGYAGIVSMQQGVAINALVKEKYEHILLDTNNLSDPQWGTNWDTYNRSNENVFNLAGWTQGGTENLKNKLIEKCKELVTIKVKNFDDDLYKNFTKYCARGVTIKDEIEKLGLVALDIKERDGKDETIWEKRKGAKNDLDSEMKLLKIDTNAIDATKIKTGCKNVIAKKKQEKDYASILQAYKKVCIKQENE